MTVLQEGRGSEFGCLVHGLNAPVVFVREEPHRPIARHPAQVSETGFGAVKFKRAFRWKDLLEGRIVRAGCARETPLCYARGLRT